MVQPNPTVVKKPNLAKGKPPVFRLASPPALLSPSEVLDALARDTRTCREAYIELKDWRPDAEPGATVYISGPHERELRLQRVTAPSLLELLCPMCGAAYPDIVSYRPPSLEGRVFIRCKECALLPPDKDGVRKRRGAFGCFDILHDEFSIFVPKEYIPKKTSNANAKVEKAVPPPTPNPANSAPAVSPASVAAAASAVAAGSPVPGKGVFTPENAHIFLKALLSAKAERQAEVERKTMASNTPTKRSPASSAIHAAASGVPSSSKTSAGSAASSDDEEENLPPARPRAASNASSVGTAASDSAPRALAPFPLKRAGLNNSRELTVMIEHLDHNFDTRQLLINGDKLEFSTLALYFEVLAKPKHRPIALEFFSRKKREWVQFGRYSSLPIHPTQSKVIGRFVHSPGLSLDEVVIEISDDDSPPKKGKKRSAGVQAGPSDLKKRRGANKGDEDEDPFGFFS
ncbi:hypothetical protein AURDEDRAFT_171539 [Auricularia subglabra TFB-10046 SS5]|nr:hypothetical protein AURDEDRAFT_171539 [Auricularia subglabra TFB-10046 SS5]